MLRFTVKIKQSSVTPQIIRRDLHTLEQIGNLKCLVEESVSCGFTRSDRDSVPLEIECWRHLTCLEIGWNESELGARTGQGQ